MSCVGKIYFRNKSFCIMIMLMVWLITINTQFLSKIADVKNRRNGIWSYKLHVAAGKWLKAKLFAKIFV